MSKDKYIKDDEEYQFPNDDEFIGETDSEHESDYDEDDDTDIDTSSESDLNAEDDDSKLNQVLSRVKSVVSDVATRFPILKNKKVMITAGFIAGSIIVINVMTPSHKVDTSAMTQPSSTKVAPPAQQQAPVNQQKIDSLSSQQSAAKQDVDQLKTKVSQLSSSLSSVQQSQRATNQTMQQLSQQMQQLSTQLTALSKTQQAMLHPKDENGVPKAKPITYHLKAVESGRAWIIGSDNQSKSVIVGNTIDKNYGKVVSIDADQGLVYTSSKQVIQFGPNDQ